MKKRYTLVVFALTLVSLIWFEPIQAQDFKGGITLGANFSQVDGDQYGGYNKLGLNAGMYIFRDLNEESKIQFEILYSQKGSKKRICTDCAIPDPTFSLRYHYIEIPILYVRSFGEIEGHIGTGVSINVLARREDNGIISDDDKLNRMEIPVHLGVSYPITDRTKVFLRHSYSLLRAGNPYSGATYLFTQNGLYNRLFTLGVRFGN
jgi:hypothetical protein